MQGQLPADVASVETVVNLHYEVRSPSGRSVWTRAAGPFKNISQAKAHLATLKDVESHRITETTTTVRILEVTP